ncbi:uncharacterized protein LOC100193985 [Zea mays]|jgi:hypothetical protein|uniref:Uncharacterized protein n=1 Tax=Zea mays TaxID=4577 RepID=B4FH03_MAIZE|nr:uncharacterized protein LOC100193985 [Zea mays]ACF81396.1 unknown [Zea mays]AQK49956.1 hypothetical protein ZEAMMB73_Zm00001d049257 [Zea mays]|eukprot:NP_001132523.1 uncharacterized protein LOC100193985 [Zea mays]
MVDTSTSPNSAAAGGGTIIDDLHGFLRHGLHTHSSVLCAHAFLFRRGLLLGHPVPAGLLIASACSAASTPAHILRLIRHLPPPLPLFSLDAALRALSPRIPFSALLSLFAALLRSHHPLFPDHFSFPPLLSAAASATSPRAAPPPRPPLLFAAPRCQRPLPLLCHCRRHLVRPLPVRRNAIQGHRVLQHPDDGLSQNTRWLGCRTPGF